MSEFPLPKRNEASPQPRRMLFAVGSSVRARVEFDELADRAARLEVAMEACTNHLREDALNAEYSAVRRQLDAMGEPDTDLPSDRIVKANELGPSLTASLIHGALAQWGDGTTEVDQVAQVIAGAIRLEAERIAERERDKVLVVVRQLTDTVQVLVEALERNATQGPKEVA